MKDSDQALKSGDFAAYGAAQNRLDQAVQDALSAENRLGGASPTPTPTSTP
jgi:hypothetical protein